MPLSKEIIDRTLRSPQGEAAYKIVEKLSDAGFQTFWVGGCVRDMLLGVIPSDIDIGTAALPQQIMHLYPKGDDTSAAFGSIHIPLGAFTFHVTTFREDDTASDGRHPEAVAFGTRMQDAARRDFTVNTIYFHPITRELYDPFHGEQDLRERLVRFIGDPAIRIKHDALRLLRAVRLRALLSGVPRSLSSSPLGELGATLSLPNGSKALRGQYHPETYRALQELAHTVELLSGARQLEELEKMLLIEHPERALEDLWELGILRHFLPELHACKGIPQPADYHHEGDVWEHTLKCTQAFKPDHGIDVRLGALFHDSGKAETFSLRERIRFDAHATVSGELTKKALDRLQCPGKRRDKIVWLVRHHMMMGSFFEMSEEKKGHWYYHPWFSELLQLFFLDIAGTDPADFGLLDRILDDYHHFLNAHPRPPKSLLTGEEVMELLGLKPGEEVGRILRELHEAQLKKQITTKREAKDFVLRRMGKS